MSIFENGLLWSVWETASVFGHWVEHFWEACIIHAAQEGLRYFTKGQQTASAFHEQLSCHWQLIYLDTMHSLNEHRPAHWTDDLVIQISFNHKLRTNRRMQYKSNSWDRWESVVLRSELFFSPPFMNVLVWNFCSQLNKRLVLYYCTCDGFTCSDLNWNPLWCKLNCQSYSI